MFDPSAQDCTVDLGLVMDNTKGDFGLIKDFASHLVSKFQISDDISGTRIGAITFGKTPTIRLLFKDLIGSQNSLQDVKEQIKSWPADGKSNTADIAEALNYADDFLYQEHNGMRIGPSVKQVMYHRACVQRS